MPDNTRFERVHAAFVFLTGLLLCAGVASAEDESLPPGDSPPPTVFSRVADAGEAEDHDGADYIIVYDRAMNRVKSSGVTYVDGYIIYKMLTPKGCRDRSVLTWRYEPWSSYVEVLEVNVIRGDERTRVDVTRVHDLPAPQSGIYWGSRLKTLQLPRLLVNDGVEVKTFRKGYSYALLAESGDGAMDSGGGRADGTSGLAMPDAPEGGGPGSAVVAQVAGGSPAGAFQNAEQARASLGVPGDDKYIPPMPGEYFDIVLFEASVPILEKKYILSLPSDKRLHSQIFNGPLYSSTSYAPDSTYYSWWALDTAARASEPREAAWSDCAAKVVIATVESWEAKSRWFLDVNRNQFEVTPEIRDKVEQIFAEAGLSGASEERKAEALVHWVAQNIRYSGQTMGEGEGFTLHPGSMIFEQRSGVCKDIAGMLITMMRAAGMDSYAAMTMAGSRIESVPADQFNHCVCALRKENGLFEMYDPTWVPYNNDIWSKYETEQQYLIGSPEGEPLATIPYSPPEESPLNVVHDAELFEDGSLKGTLRLSGAGALDTRLRHLVSSSRIVDVEDDIARLLSSIGRGVEDIRFKHPETDDFSQDMRVEISYRVPRFALPVDEGLEFTSPMMAVTMSSGWLFRAGVYDWTEERESDVFLYFTQLVDGTETIRLPRGYELRDPPSSGEVDETYAYFKGESEMDGRNLVVRQHAEVRRRQIPPDGYDGFKAAIDEAKEWEGQVYRIEKGGHR